MSVMRRAKDRRIELHATCLGCLADIVRYVPSLKHDTTPVRCSECIGRIVNAEILAEYRENQRSEATERVLH